MDYNDEAKLVQALKNGDIAAFDKLFSGYGSRLYHFSIGYLKLKEEAEEVVQEVFLRVWRNRSELKPELSFKSYLFTIAYHLILEYFEKINRRLEFKHQIIEESFNFTDDMEDRLNYRLLLEKVDRLIVQLPLRQREILLKRKKGGISVKDIANELKISPKTVENHLTEALKNIKKGLGEEDISSMLFFFLFINN